MALFGPDLDDEFRIFLPYRLEGAFEHRPGIRPPGRNPRRCAPHPEIRRPVPRGDCFKGGAGEVGLTGGHCESLDRRLGTVDAGHNAVLVRWLVGCHGASCPNVGREA